MKTETGVWIDTERAMIIELKDGQSEVGVINSGIETRERFEGEDKKFTRVGSVYIDPETNDERRFDQQVDRYLDTVKAALSNAEALVIMGPAQMKKRLEKLLLEDKSFDGKVLGVEPADKMSENQMVAWVKDYFSHIAEEKS
jgi:hypothetical protein